jgi:hypothetical protein
MEYEFFTSIMTPGIALLILSTTMRIGNVRLALTELAKMENGDLEALEGYRLFKDRALYLCRGLRLLNISLLILIPGALAKLNFRESEPTIEMAIVFVDTLFFIVLFLAVVFLYKESQLTGQSIINHTNDIRASHRKSD